MASLFRRVLAPNPGPMTLDGTNSYLLAAPDAASVIVVDPGPADDGHLAELAAAGHVELILLTHHHDDHVEGAAALAEATGAPVRAFDAALCRNAGALVDGEVIEAAGVRLRVITTPGHTADSVCFHLAEEGAAGAVLTGDTVLGRGTTIIADPDGALGPYLRSLETLRSLGSARVLPGHGPELDDLSLVAAAYLAHRAGRLDEVRRALVELGADASNASVGAVTDLVYAGTDPAVRPAAEASVRAQLAYLRAGTD